MDHKNSLQNTFIDQFTESDKKRKDETASTYYDYIEEKLKNYFEEKHIVGEFESIQESVRNKYQGKDLYENDNYFEYLAQACIDKIVEKTGRDRDDVFKELSEYCRNNFPKTK